LFPKIPFPVWDQTAAQQPILVGDILGFSVQGNGRPLASVSLAGRATLARRGQLVIVERTALEAQEVGDAFGERERGNLRGHLVELAAEARDDLGMPLRMARNSAPAIAKIA